MEKITSKTYDKDILSQGLQFQVDTYYEPKQPFGQCRIDIILKFLDSEPQERILDIGCGVGTFAFHTAKQGTVSFGIDYSYESIKVADFLCRGYHLVGKVIFIVGDAMHLPFVNSFFDKIAIIDFIEHITWEERAKLLKEVKRVLADGGKIIIFTPNRVREVLGNFYHRMRYFLFKTKIPANPRHYGLITKTELERLLKEEELFFKFFYYDLTRPYLAKIPVFNRFLSLNLLCVVGKKRV